MSFEQASFDLGVLPKAHAPSTLPMLNQNNVQDEELTWKQLTVPQNNTLLTHIIHILLLTPLLLWSGATVEVWKINSTLVLVFLCWIMNCHALIMFKICKTFGDTVHQVENKNQPCIRTFMSHFIQNYTNVDILQQLSTSDISAYADFPLQDASLLQARLLSHNGLQLLRIQWLYSSHSEPL